MNERHAALEAQERAALRAWLEARDAPPELLEVADRALAACQPSGIAAVSHIPDVSGLVAELVLSEGATLSARGLADRSGVDTADVVRFFRHFGVLVKDPLAPRFTDEDAQLAELEAAGEHELASDFEDAELARVVATALERIAEAAIALYVQGPERALAEAGADAVTEADKAERATRMALLLGRALGILFRHHMRQAVERHHVTRSAARRPELTRLAVGFVDLAGSTAVAADLDPAKLAAMVSHFEARAFDIVSDGNGRLVKFIGDEIMVAAPDAACGCRIVHELVTAFGAEGLRPRGGLVHGDVLFRHGDYYGPLVNLASRLVNEAIPGEVLVDGSILDATTTTGEAERPRFEPAGRRLLKGFDEPVRVWALSLE